MSDGMDMYFIEVKDAVETEMEMYEVDETSRHDVDMMKECYDRFIDDIRDSVTGNADGSYTMSRQKAKENLESVIFDEKMWSSLKYNELTSLFAGYLAESDFEACDIIIRDLVLMDNYGVFCDMFFDQFYIER